MFIIAMKCVCCVYRSLLSALFGCLQSGVGFALFNGHDMDLIW